MGSEITVSGGSGGIGANLDDMRSQAAVLEAMTGALLDKARSSAHFAVAPDLLSSAVLSPITAVAAEERIVAATGRLVLYATEAGVSAVFLEGAVVAYESVDQALAELARIGTNAVTFVAGSLVIPLAVVGAVIVLDDDVVASYVSGYGEELGESIENAVDRMKTDPSRLLAPLGVVGVVAGSFSARAANAEATAILGAQLGALQTLAQEHAQELIVLLGENAGIIDFIARGTPGLLTGLVAPLSYGQAIQAVIDAGNKAGLLEDGGPIGESDLFVPPPIRGQGGSAPRTSSWKYLAHRFGIGSRVPRRTTSRPIPLP